MFLFMKIRSLKLLSRPTVASSFFSRHL